MSILDTNNLNFLLSLKLPDELKEKLKADLRLLYPQKNKPKSHPFIDDEIYIIIDNLIKIDTRKSLPYLIANTPTERAIAIMENSNQEMIDKIFDLVLSYCKQVDELEQILLDWHK